MKYKITLVLSLIFAQSWAQNYSTINRFSETYFAPAKNGKYGNQQVKATRFDSFEQVDNDRHFFSFNSLKQYGPNYPDYKRNTCDYYLSHSWIGPKVIQDSLGWDHYFNDSFERFSFNRNARFDDTFTVFHYPTGETVKAVVVSELWKEVLGKNQRVKAFKLFSDHPDFLSSGITLELSEYYGWTQWINPQNFPRDIDEKFNGYLYLEGLLNDTLKVGVTRLTRGDVFDFKVGDSFKKHYGSQLHNSYEWYITARDDQRWADRVVYEATKAHRWYEYVPADEYTYEYRDTTTVTLAYDNLSHYLVDLLPEEFIMPKNIGWGDFLTNTSGAPMRIRYCDDYKFVIQHVGSTDGGTFYEYKSDSCIDVYFCVGPVDEFEASAYASGIGHYEGSKMWNLVDFHKKGTSCGELSGLNIETANEYRPVIFPNPTSGIIRIMDQDVNRIVVLSNIGQKIIESDHFVNELDLSHLPDGLYHVILFTDDGQINHQVLKN